MHFVIFCFLDPFLTTENPNNLFQRNDYKNYLGKSTPLFPLPLDSSQGFGRWLGRSFLSGFDSLCMDSIRSIVASKLNKIILKFN